MAISPGRARRPGILRIIALGGSTRASEVHGHSGPFRETGTGDATRSEVAAPSSRIRAVNGNAPRVGLDLRRRDFLRLGVLSGLVLPLGCSAARRVAAPATAEGVLQFPVALSEHHFAILVTLVEGLYPGDERRPAGLALGVPQRADEEFYFAPEHVRAQFELALDVLEWGGPVAGWWGRFTGLERDERAGQFAKLFDHPFDSFRQVAVGLSQVVRSFYYADERSWPAIGYDGPWQPPKPPDSAAHYAAELERLRAEHES